MNKIEVPVGTRYGKWITASEKYKIGDNKHYSIDVVCDCGTTLTMKSATLTSGRATRCWNCYNGTRPTLLDPETVVVNYVYGDYLKSARRRNLGFGLTKQTVKNLIFRECNYCGASPKNKVSDRAKKPRVLPRYNGIDRVNNNRGYIAGNVVTCCSWCNQAKRAKTNEEWVNWVKGLAKWVS